MLLRVAFTGDTGKLTATAGTAIQALIPPRKGCKTRIVSLRYTPAATAHVLTIMRPLARTTVLAAAAAGQAVVVLKIDPGTLLAPARILAANDFIVLEGVTPSTGYYVYILGKVSAVAAGTAAGSLNVTLTANLPTGGVPVNAVCWMLGVTTDGHPQVAAAASATLSLADAAVGIFGARGRYEPLVINADNVTAAGTLENAAIAYTDEAQFGSSTLLPGQEGQTSAAQAEGMETDEDGDTHLIPAYCVSDEEIQAVLSELHNPQPAWLTARQDGQQFAPQQGDPPVYVLGTGFAPGCQVIKDPEGDEEVQKWVEQIYGEWPGQGEPGEYMPPANDSGGQFEEAAEGAEGSGDSPMAAPAASREASQAHPPSGGR